MQKMRRGMLDSCSVQLNGDTNTHLHLTRSGAVLANDTSNHIFCIAKDVADPKMLQAALDWACEPGKVECSPLLQGQQCYELINVMLLVYFLEVLAKVAP
ncbi:Glucan endo-1,3-beta-glucosidase 2 [Spatholobus suberectus]|nr:Glucan endo-1,3-beta-glucosidase 2 [Spatholobus suberectus]